MALFYTRNTIVLEGKNITIRPIEDDDDYVVAISMDTDSDDDEVNEVLLTREEVNEIVDAAFNQ